VTRLYYYSHLIEKNVDVDANIITLKEENVTAEVFHNFIPSQIIDILALPH
jgi:hypothetical protein